MSTLSGGSFTRLTRVVVAVALACAHCPATPELWASPTDSGPPRGTHHLPLDPVHLDLDALTVPDSLGYVEEVWQPHDRAPDGVIIHIQDLHTHPEAQEHIADLLGYLHETYGLSLVTLEGAADLCDPSFFSAFPLPDIVARISRLFVEHGLFTGAEHYAITHPGRVTLWGVEDAATYLAHLTAYQEGAVVSAEAHATLAALRRHLEPMIRRLFPAALRRLATLRAAAEADGASEGALPRYAGELLAQARRLRLDLAPWVQTRAYVRATQLSRALARRQTEAERQRLLHEYHALSDRIQAGALMEEVETLQHAVEDALLTAPKPRALAQLLRWLEMVEGLSGTKLSRRQLRAYHEMRQPLTADAVWERLRQVTGQHAPITKATLERLTQQLTTHERFYGPALARDDLLVRNTLACLNKFVEQLPRSPHPEPRTFPNAILITGGFHTAGITQRLREQHVAYAVITPRVEQPFDESRYRARLAGHVPEPRGVLEQLRQRRRARPFPSTLQRALGTSELGSSGQVTMPAGRRFSFGAYLKELFSAGYMSALERLGLTRAEARQVALQVANRGPDRVTLRFLHEGGATRPSTTRRTFLHRLGTFLPDVMVRGMLAAGLVRSVAALARADRKDVQPVLADEKDHAPGTDSQPKRRFPISRQLDDMGRTQRMGQVTQLPDVRQPLVLGVVGKAVQFLFRRGMENVAEHPAGYVRGLRKDLTRRSTSAAGRHDPRRSALVARAWSEWIIRRLDKVMRSTRSSRSSDEMTDGGPRTPHKCFSWITVSVSFISAPVRLLQEIALGVESVKPATAVTAGLVVGLVVLGLTDAAAAQGIAHVAGDAVAQAVQTLAAAPGGDPDVTTALGRGTMFTISLPATSPTAQGSTTPPSAAVKEIGGILSPPSALGILGLAGVGLLTVVIVGLLAFYSYYRWRRTWDTPAVPTTLRGLLADFFYPESRWEAQGQPVVFGHHVQTRSGVVFDTHQIVPIVVAAGALTLLLATAGGWLSFPWMMHAGQWVAMGGVGVAWGVFLHALYRGFMWSFPTMRRAMAQWILRESGSPPAPEAGESRRGSPFEPRRPPTQVLMTNGVENAAASALPPYMVAFRHALTQRLNVPVIEQPAFTSRYLTLRWMRELRRAIDIFNYVLRRPRLVTTLIQQSDEHEALTASPTAVVAYSAGAELWLRALAQRPSYQVEVLVVIDGTALTRLPALHDQLFLKKVVLIHGEQSWMPRWARLTPDKVRAAVRPSVQVIEHRLPFSHWVFDRPTEWQLLINMCMTELIGEPSSPSTSSEFGLVSPAFPTERVESVLPGVDWASRDQQVPEQCVTGDTLLAIHTNDVQGSGFGVRGVPIKDVKAGMLVYSLNEATGRLEPRRINGLLDMGVKPVYRLTTASGRTIRTTGTHPYLTPQGWRKVARLRVGDDIAVASLVNAVSSAHRGDETVSVGQFKDDAIIGDAEPIDMARSPHQRFSKLEGIRSAQQEVVELADDLVLNVPGKLAQLPFGMRRPFIGEHYPRRFFTTVAERRSEARAARSRFTKAGLNDSMSSTMRSSSSTTLFGSDQLKDSATPRKSSSFRSSSAGSTGFSSPARKALGFHWIPSILRWTSRKATSSLVTSSFGSSARRILATERYGPSNSSVGIAAPRTAPLAGPSIPHRHHDAYAEVRWEPIFSLEVEGRERVYDIEVEGTHTFVANGIVAHNTYLGGLSELRGSEGTVSPEASRVGLPPEGPAQIEEGGARSSKPADDESLVAPSTLKKLVRRFGPRHAAVIADEGVQVLKRFRPDLPDARLRQEINQRLRTIKPLAWRTLMRTGMPLGLNIAIGVFLGYGVVVHLVFGDPLGRILPGLLVVVIPLAIVEAIHLWHNFSAHGLNVSPRHILIRSTRIATEDWLRYVTAHEIGHRLFPTHKADEEEVVPEMLARLREIERHGQWVVSPQLHGDPRAAALEGNLPLLVGRVHRGEWTVSELETHLRTVIRWRSANVQDAYARGVIFADAVFLLVGGDFSAAYRLLQRYGLTHSLSQAVTEVAPEGGSSHASHGMGIPSVRPHHLGGAARRESRSASQGRGSQGDDIPEQCVTGDTLLAIHTNDVQGSGFRVRGVAIKDVKAGMLVYSLNEATGRLEPRRIKGLLAMGTKPVYRLTTASGRSIRTTGTHPYLTPQGWRKVSTLAVGTQVAVTGDHDAGGSRMTSHRNGNSSWRSGSTTTSLSVKSSADGLSSSTRWSAVFSWSKAPGTILSRTTPGWCSVGCHLAKSLSWVRSTRCAEAAAANTAPLDKPLGERAVSWPNPVRNGTSPRWTFSSSKKRIADFQKGGIQLAVFQYPRGVMERGLNVLWREVGVGLLNVSDRRPRFEHLQDEIHHDPRAFEARLAVADFRVHRDVLFNQVHGILKVPQVWHGARGVSSTGGSQGSSDVQWDRIVSIEAVGREPVYDIEVEGTHNFVANGLLAHNTSLGTQAERTNDTRLLQEGNRVSSPDSLVDAPHESGENEASGDVGNSPQPVQPPEVMPGEAGARFRMTDAPSGEQGTAAERVEDVLRSVEQASRSQ